MKETKTIPLLKVAAGATAGARRRCPARVILLLLAALGLGACGKKPEPPPPGAAAAPVSRAKGSGTAKALPAPAAPAGEAPPARAERDEALVRAIDDYKREHPFANATELLKQEAFLVKLRPLLESAVKEHGFVQRVQRSVDFAAEQKEGRSAPGAYSLDLKVDNYTPEQTDRLLGTVLSGRPENLVNFVLGEIDQAAAEFTFSTDQDRSSNGVAVRPKAPPPEPQPQQQAPPKP